MQPYQSKDTDLSGLDEAGQNEYDGRNFDRLFHALLSRFGSWLSPTSLMLAYDDWLACLSISPAKQQDLHNNALKKIIKFFLYVREYYTNKFFNDRIPVHKSDPRFEHELWNHPPFHFYAQFFLLSEQWWDEATTHLNGVSKHHQKLVNFVSRQLLDILSPSNIPLLNPEILTTTVNQNGMNFVYGFYNFIEDLLQYMNGKPPIGSEKFQVGVNVAVTPGKIIYRNSLIELIQYCPTTKTVYPEPILIIPAWIMKYYILDLSPYNSMVKYLINNGHTVFMISWKNPGSVDKYLSLSDYTKFGILDALRSINYIVPQQKIHAVGYCVGGTLLTITAALMAAKSDERLQSVTLFAAQTDFNEAGELLLFIDENQVAYLEDIMWDKGYLDGSQMAGAFSMLRSIDLIWSRVIRDYLIGQRRPITALMAWDYDTTRIPYKMHTEYLRKLFLNNDLVEGRLKILNEPINLADINVPMFAVTTLKDHVAPWKSVYKLHYFIDTNVTFVLANAGHNTGIVNVPGEPGRNFQMLTHKRNEKHLTPERWKIKAPSFSGSWWPTWQSWLADYSGKKISPPALGNAAKNLTPICDAPGIYVLQN